MAKQLNQYAIGRILGSEIRQIGEIRFGGFGLLQTSAEIATGLRCGSERVSVPAEYNARIAQAFEDIRDGWAPDRLLWDKGFSDAFVRRCQELGVALPPVTMKRRLLAIRKDIHRYEKAGIVLSPTTRKEPHPGIRDEGAAAIEFALVRLKYRYGVSIDDLLLDSELAEEFERIATSVGPALSSEELRRGALYLRKTRHFSKKMSRQYADMNSEAIEAAMKELGVSAHVSLDAIPESPGIAEVLEDQRYLFVCGSTDVRRGLAPFLEKEPLARMGDAFWRPDPESIRLRLYVGAKFEGIGIHDWQLKLIHDRRPVFNWPVIGSAA